MTNETHQITLGEIRAYEAKAHVLRANAMREGSKAFTSFLSRLFHRAVDAFSRPAHA